MLTSVPAPRGRRGGGAVPGLRGLAPDRHQAGVGVDQALPSEPGGLERSRTSNGERSLRRAMGASIGGGPEIGPPMGAQSAAGATGPAGASQVIAVDHRRPFEVHLGNFVRARVERTFAWLGRCRRLAEDFENLAVNALAFLCLGMIRLMLRRLARASAT